MFSDYLVSAFVSILLCVSMLFNFGVSEALVQELSKGGSAQSAKKPSGRSGEFEQLWRTPIVFFGRVLDETNCPVRGAQVSYSANSADEQLTREVRYEGTVFSDERGIFKISGIRGRSLTLEVSHPRYYGSSSNLLGFDYAGELHTGRGVPDTESDALIFRLHHKGQTVALVERNGGLHKPADGATMEFPLRGKARDQIIGRVLVRGWKAQPDPQTGRYDWRVKVAVEDGGLLESTNEFEFTAPLTGYVSALEFAQSKGDQGWSSNVRKKFFFKLPKYFARGEAYIDTYHDLYFSMNYFVNPYGAANLEKDPTQTANEQ